MTAAARPVWVEYFCLKALCSVDRPSSSADCCLILDFLTFCWPRWCQWTCYPKPPEVIAAFCSVLAKVGCSKFAIDRAKVLKSQRDSFVALLCMILPLGILQFLWSHWTYPCVHHGTYAARLCAFRSFRPACEGQWNHCWFNWYRQQSLSVRHSDSELIPLIDSRFR